MMSLRFSLPLFAIAVSVCSAQTDPVTPTTREPDRESLLSLPWKEFDQTQNSGWRWYVNPGRKRYLEAAKLIETYLARHDELTPRQRALCHFHASHNYLFRHLRTGAGDPLDAIPHLDQAIVPGGATPPSADWNDLVIATKAFLLQDRLTLLSVKERVAAMPAASIKFLKSPNSPDDLIDHLGQPYGSWFPQPEPKK
jgi:hypothetical protein